MAAPYHNLLSKNDRAIAAYLVSIGAGTTDDVFPAKRSQSRQTPCTVIYSESADEVAPYSATYTIKTSVMIRTYAGQDYDEADADKRKACDQRVAATFDGFHWNDDNNQSGDTLATAITNAARADALANPDNADLADYTVLNIRVVSIEQGQESDVDAWVDTINLECVACPSNVS